MGDTGSLDYDSYSPLLNEAQSTPAPFACAMKIGGRAIPTSSPHPVLTLGSWI